MLRYAIVKKTADLQPWIDQVWSLSVEDYNKNRAEVWQMIAKEAKKADADEIIVAIGEGTPIGYVRINIGVDLERVIADLC